MGGGLGCRGQLSLAVHAQPTIASGGWWVGPRHGVNWDISVLWFFPRSDMRKTSRLVTLHFPNKFRRGTAACLKYKVSRPSSADRNCRERSLRLGACWRAHLTIRRKRRQMAQAQVIEGHGTHLSKLTLRFRAFLIQSCVGQDEVAGSQDCRDAS